MLVNKISPGLSEWEKHFSKEIFGRFAIKLFSDICTKILSYIKKKRLNQIGVLILNKEIAILKEEFLNSSTKKRENPFEEMEQLLDILMLETKEEVKRFARDANMDAKRIDMIIKLRVDFI